MDKKNRKRRSVEIPVCKYGLSCYQKNPEHHKKFRHPDMLIQEQSSSDVTDSDSAGSAAATEKISVETEKEIHTKISVNGKNNDVVPEKEESSLPEVKFSETVEQLLESMPKDFFDFWKFCTSINKTHPEDAFADLGFYLVGMYDILAKELPKNKSLVMHCHWRYYYDPPEFQTVIKLDGDKLYHIGYFRDEPDKCPSILASNSASDGPELVLKGDNIFAAMNAELSQRLPKLKVKLKKKYSDVQQSLRKFAAENKHSLDINSSKTKARKKKVVAKTFHGLGIVVPFANDVGYRPLPDSNSVIKSFLKKIIDAKDEDYRLSMEENLDDLITNVQFANDECDFGMGLELGIDLFCYGEPYFHQHILNILPLAYELLQRPKYAEIVKFHLANRKISNELSALDL